MPTRNYNVEEVRGQTSVSVNNPLRPALYARLTEFFGGDVIIANEGEEMVSTYSSNYSEVPALSVDIPGEYYRVNCPYCTDTRRRLWINHRWGQRDDHGKLNLFLAHCYNENCMAEPGNSWNLYKQLFTDFS